MSLNRYCGGKEIVLSHDSNVSAGVAILFHSTLKAKILSRYLFSHLADAFIQSDLQMRTL